MSQQLLDNKLFPRERILRYEKMFGDGYITTGEPNTTKEFVTMLDLKPGQRVLDVGAGIGGADFYMAEKYDVEVFGIDLSSNMNEIAMERAQEHKDLKVHFEIADVTKLDCEPESFDAIYSRDTIIHIADKRAVFDKFTTWLKPGGKLLIIDYSSGDMPHTDAFNADVTQRCYTLCTVEQYGKFIKEAGFINMKAEDRTWQFMEMLEKEEVMWEKENDKYIKGLWTKLISYVTDGDLKWGLFFAKKKELARPGTLSNSHNQCWPMQKAKRNMEANHGIETLQQFLDNHQYPKQSIRSFEMIYGHGYVTTGGLQTTKEIVAMLDLRPGQRVLDVGAGTGGEVFYMAERYGVEVVGIDLSSNMNEIALERAKEHKDLKVQFEMADVTKSDYEPESFDVIYSRDTLVHIADKRSVFNKFWTWLKPGGKLLISDYCCGDLPLTDAFNAYVAQGGYNLHTPKQYGKLLEEAGFISVKAEDRTKQFMEALEVEHISVEKHKDELIKASSEEDYTFMASVSTTVMTQTRDGDHKWGLFLAQKKEGTSILTSERSEY